MRASGIGLSLLAGGSVVACALLTDLGDLSGAADGSTDGLMRDSAVESGPDAQPRCNAAAAFGAPIAPGDPVNVLGKSNTKARLSTDELALVLSSNRDDAVSMNRTDIYLMTRASTQTQFPSTADLSTASACEESPSITADKLTLAFFYNPSNAIATAGIAFLRRASAVVNFKGTGYTTGDGGALVGDTPAASTNPTCSKSTADQAPFLSADGRTLAFVRASKSPHQIYFADVDLGNDASATVVISNVRPIAELRADAGAADDDAPVLTSDGLALYFGSSRAGSMDIWVARRASTADPFGAPARVSELATPSTETPSWVSPDECELYFDRNGQVMLASKP